MICATKNHLGEDIQILRENGSISQKSRRNSGVKPPHTWQHQKRSTDRIPHGSPPMPNPQKNSRQKNRFTQIFTTTQKCRHNTANISNLYSLLPLLLSCIFSSSSNLSCGSGAAGTRRIRQTCPCSAGNWGRPPLRWRTRSWWPSWGLLSLEIRRRH